MTQEYLMKQLFGEPEPGSVHIGDEEREETKSVLATQRASLEKWENGTETSLAELCNAYLTTSEDADHVKGELKYVDEDSAKFLTETVTTWTAEALPRLAKLIAARATAESTKTGATTETTTPAN
jgi:hypothetical protein